MHCVRGGAGSRYLLTPHIAAAVPHVTDRNGGPMSPRKIASLTPILRRRNGLCSTYCDLFPWRTSRVPGGHRVELAAKIWIPLKTGVHFQPVIIHCWVISLHHHRSICKGPSFVILIVGICAEREYILTAGNW